MSNLQIKVKEYKDITIIMKKNTKYCNYTRRNLTNKN